ncbi:hypothetical protein EON63_04965 [archaeon]|nr:MAG: hypothetical protein EON63_04965 [archaeon]
MYPWTGVPKVRRGIDIPYTIHHTSYTLHSQYSYHTPPPSSRLDSTTAAEVKEHWGSHELLEAIRRTKPAVHLHGHVKDSRGVMPPFGNAPLTLNSAMVDKDVTVLYAAAQVVKASQLMAESSKNTSWVFTLDSLDV